MKGIINNLQDLFMSLLFIYFCIESILSEVDTFLFPNIVTGTVYGIVTFILISNLKNLKRLCA